MLNVYLNFLSRENSHFTSLSQKNSIREIVFNLVRTQRPHALSLYSPAPPPAPSPRASDSGMLHTGAVQ